MNPDNPNPMFSFAPKPFTVKEQKPTVETPPQYEVPLFQPQIKQEPVLQPAEMNGARPADMPPSGNDAVLAKLNELESLILQRQQPPAEREHGEEIVQQLRAHTLQIAKLTKELKMLEHQNSAEELKSEIDTLSAQLRSTNLYLSKIDRKIDYLMNIIGTLQDKQAEEGSGDNRQIVQSLRTQALMLSKLERKIGEILYHQQNR